MASVMQHAGKCAKIPQICCFYQPSRTSKCMLSKQRGYRGYAVFAGEQKVRSDVSSRNVRLYSLNRDCRIDPSPYFHTAPRRFYASTQRKGDTRQIVESSEKPFTELSTAQKVQRAGKDATYTGIVLLGIGVTGVMVYAIGRELFSSQSPSGIYSAALKKCRQDSEIIDLVGTPMKGYGEMTRRGRRRHVSHTEYERDGMKFLRMKFYIEGPLAKGTVHLEMRKDENGKWDYRYLFAEIDSYPRRTVIIHDNR